MQPSPEGLGALSLSTFSRENESSLTLFRPNHEKLFYRALTRFREEQLENYPGTPLEYSASDYHHITKPLPRQASTRTGDLGMRAHNRRRSQFSIVSDDNRNRDTYYKDPATSASTTTGGSYDPYRSSKTPIVGNSVDHSTVVVRHGSATSRARGSQSASLKHRALSRLQYGAVSSPPSGDLERLGQLKRHSYASATSRGSLASTRRGNGETGVRKSASYKRHVSFQHHRQRSSGTFGAWGKSSRHQRLISLDGESPGRVENAAQAISESQSTPSVPTPSQLCRSRKAASDIDVKSPRATSHCWRDEARKVSTELGKICEEAFNRSSISSSSVSHKPTDSPATSVSTHGEAAARMSTHLKNRPLPQPPAESLGTYTLRELADLRRRLLEHCQKDKEETIPTHVRDTIAHLDILLDVDCDRVDLADRRSASDPTSTSSSNARKQTLSNLPRRDLTGLGFEGSALRVASNPVRARHEATFENATIRLVTPDPTSPMQVIHPLNIRKNKTPAAASSINVGCSGAPRSAYDRRPYEARFYGAGGLDTIEEDPSPPRKRGAVGSSSGGRKWSWLKRSSDPAAECPPPPAKNSPVKSGPIGLETSNSQTSSNTSRGEPVLQGVKDGEAAVETKRKWFRKMFGRAKGRASVPAAIGDHEIVEDFSETESELGGGDDGPLTRPDRRRPVKNAGIGRKAGAGQAIHVSQNWFAKFFYVKPASKIICLSTNKARARKEVVKILKEWKKYGLKDVVSDRRADGGYLIRGRVDAVNREYYPDLSAFSALRGCLLTFMGNLDLHLKPVHFHAHLFTVLEHGRKGNLSVARFTQEKGAASSFYKVVETLETVLRVRGLLVEDDKRWKGIEKAVTESGL